MNELKNVGSFHEENLLKDGSFSQTLVAVQIALMVKSIVLYCTLKKLIGYIILYKLICIFSN